MDMANPTISGQGSPTLGHPANSGWTSKCDVFAKETILQMQTLYRTNASYTKSTVTIIIGRIIVYASVSRWTRMGGTQLFPASHNT